MKSKSITVVCILLTAIVLSVFGYGVSRVGIPEHLNEIGDSIAGIAGALAFIWLAGGLFIQQSELALTREEYQKLRENSDLEQELAVTKLYTTGLEHNIKVFSEVFDVMKQDIDEFKQSSENIPTYYKISLFCDFCISIDTQNTSATYKKVQSHASIYSSALRKYYNIFNQLEGYVETSSQKEVLESSILKNAMYSDIFEAIKKGKANSNILKAAFN